LDIFNYIVVQCLPPSEGLAAHSIPLQRSRSTAAAALHWSSSQSIRWCHLSNAGVVVHDFYSLVHILEPFPSPDFHISVSYGHKIPVSVISHGPEVLCQLLICTESIHSSCVVSTEFLRCNSLLSTTFQSFNVFFFFATTIAITSNVVGWIINHCSAFHTVGPAAEMLWQSFIRVRTIVWKSDSPIVDSIGQNNRPIR